MILPSFKSSERQAFLWDDPMGNHGHARTVLGDFAEELTARFVGGKRFKTDSRADYCPDVFGLGAYFEVKSAGRSNQTFVYEGRLEKDRWFAKEHSLFYAVWHHAANTKLASTEADLQRLFLASLRSLIVVPFDTISVLAGRFGRTPLNSKYGHSDSNQLYGAGYRIPVSALRSGQCLEIPFKHLQAELF